MASRLSFVALAGDRVLPAPDVESDRAAMGLLPSDRRMNVACPEIEDGE
jgi:hypothetical protein